MHPSVSTRIAFEEALACVVAAGRAARLDSEPVPLARARGRVLAEDLRLPIDLPPFTQSAMDGWAVRHADLAVDRSLRIVGEQPAGLDRGLVVGTGEAIRLFTGAPLPRGADTIVMQEHARRDGDALQVAQVPREGQWVRSVGGDARRGDALLRAGHRLGAVDLGVLAACGWHEVRCARRPLVALFTLGDELVAPGAPLAAGEVYDSNRALLTALLLEEGLEPVAWPLLRDDPALIASALADAAHSFDLLVTCGGASVGDHDPLPSIMAREGEALFWKVRSKPGAPVLFGRLGPRHPRTLWLGLPGNPVSVLAGWLGLGRPLLDAMQGATRPRPRCPVRLASAIDKTEARLEFVRARLAFGPEGALWATPDAATESHRLLAASRNNGLLVLPEGAARFEAGAIVEALPWGWPDLA